MRSRVEALKGTGSGRRRILSNVRPLGACWVWTYLSLHACIASPASIDGAGPGVEEVPVTVVVTGVRPGDGPVRIAVYRERATFMTREGIASGRSVPPESERVAATFLLPVDAEVAISVFQDLDSDESLDRGFLGLPTEPWGASGTPSAWSPPGWDACKLRIVPHQPPIEIDLFGTRGEQPKSERPVP